MSGRIAFHRLVYPNSTSPWLNYDRCQWSFLVRDILVIRRTNLSSLLSWETSTYHSQLCLHNRTHPAECSQVSGPCRQSASNEDDRLPWSANLCRILPKSLGNVWPFSGEWRALLLFGSPLLGKVSHRFERQTQGSPEKGVWLSPISPFLLVYALLDLCRW